MMMSAKRDASQASPRLTEADVAIIKGMVRRGDVKHHIAQYFGVNPGRVYEALKMPRFAHIAPASPENLPERGPYVVVNRVEYRKAVLSRELLNRLLGMVDGVAADFRQQIEQLAREEADAAA